ncbi:Ski6p [Saccharomyces cerevisiae FostersO]|nr:Ski6p [Saccharomyces cerevisiae FostersO]
MDVDGMNSAVLKVPSTHIRTLQTVHPTWNKVTTKIITLVKGPKEPRLKSQMDTSKALLNVSVNITKFSKFERSKSSHKNERRVLEIQTSLVRMFEKNVMLNIYPRTVIDIEIHVLEQDGGIMGSLINGITPRFNRCRYINVRLHKWYIRRAVRYYPIIRYQFIRRKCYEYSDTRCGREVRKTFSFIGGRQNSVR